MKKLLAFCASVVALTGILFADGYTPVHPPLARSLSSDQIDKVVRDAPAGSNVGVPAWYAKQVESFRDIGTNTFAKAAVPGLTAVIADSRQNIPELGELTDVEVAQLYLDQMSKPVDELQKLAPTNSLEYLIGAGMRQDLLKMKEAKR